MLGCLVDCSNCGRHFSFQIKLSLRTSHAFTQSIQTLCETNWPRAIVVDDNVALSSFIGSHSEYDYEILTHVLERSGCFRANMEDAEG